MSLVDSFNTFRRSVYDLLPSPCLHVDWTDADDREDPHITLHLQRGRQSLCSGVSYCLFQKTPTTFFPAKSRGEVTLRSLDPAANPKVQHNYLSDPLDMLVFSEACRLVNEIAVDGTGTKVIVVGSWPSPQGHDKYTISTRREKSGRLRFGSGLILAIIRLGRARWATMRWLL